MKLSIFNSFIKNSNHADFEKKLKNLRGKFRGAVRFFKKTITPKNGIPIQLSNLPWLLMIGMPHSGKTALLTQSEIPFILSKQVKNKSSKKTTSNETCHWWATKDLVIIDTPGSWLSTTKISQKLWKQFLYLLKNKNVREKLGAIIITLNLPELMEITHPKKESYLIHLKKKLFELQNTLNTKQYFHLVITKMDFLPGFNAFFQESSREERYQPWGITLPPLKNNENISNLFHHRFDALIKRINEQLIWKMHQEHNFMARRHMKDFPLQLEKIKNFITLALKIFTDQNTQACGVWLTSAIPKPHETFRFEPNLNSQLSIIQPTTALMIKQKAHPKSFFIRSLMLHTLSTPIKITPPIPNKNARIRDITFMLSGGLIIAFFIIFGKDFITNERKILSINNHLIQDEKMIKTNQNNTKLTSIISLLDTLEIKTAVHPNWQTTLFNRLLSFYTDHSEQHVHLLYQRATQMIFIPHIQKILDHFLQTANQNQPALLYEALAARLMISGLMPYQPSTIIYALNQLTQVSLDQTHFLHHLDNAANHHWLTAEINQTTIDFARQQLIRIAANELAMIVLQNQSLENISNQIHSTDIKKILDEAIPIAANAALMGNAILGEIPPRKEQPNTEALIAELHNRYDEAYHT